jgi:hypothetical protein
MGTYPRWDTIHFKKKEIVFLCCMDGTGGHYVKDKAGAEKTSVA